MGRRLRHIEKPGTVIELTTRTFQGRMLLRPSKYVNEIIIGVIGRAQRRYEIPIHALVFLSNHYHMLISADEADSVSKFMCYVNGNLSREICRVHKWSDKLWSRRYQGIVVSDEIEAQQARLRYILRHGSKEGLVDRPQDWPGVHCANALRFNGELHGYWFNRTLENAARRRGERPSRYQYATPETVRFTPFPCWNDCDPREVKEIIRTMVGEICLEAAAKRARKKMTSLGVKAITACHPHRRPEKTKRGAAPDVHANKRDVLIEMRTEYREFVKAYRRAKRRLHEDYVNPGSFPGSCFPPPPPYVTQMKACDPRVKVEKRLMRSSRGPDPPTPTVQIEG